MAFGSFLRGVAAQLNPFDRGRTYSTTQDDERRRQQAQRVIQNSKASQVLSLATPKQQAQPRVSTSQAKPKQQQPGLRIRLGDLRVGRAQMAPLVSAEEIQKNTAANRSFGNKLIAHGPEALRDTGAKSVNLGIGLGRAIQRGPTEIANTYDRMSTGNLGIDLGMALLRNQPGTQRTMTPEGPTVTPTNRVTKLLYGPEPIKTSTQSAKDFAKETTGKNLPTALAGPLGLFFSSPVGGSKIPQTTIQGLTKAGSSAAVRKIVGKNFSEETVTAIAATKDPNLIQMLVDTELKGVANPSTAAKVELNNANQNQIGKNVDPLESLKQEARKYKSAEEFGQSLSKHARTLGEVKVGETVSVAPPKDGGYMSSRRWYGDKSAGQYNGGEASGIGRVVAVNPKTVRIEYGNGKSYLVSKDALATNDLNPIIDTYGNKPTAIQDLYNQATQPPKSTPTVDAKQGTDDLAALPPEQKAELDKAVQLVGAKNADELLKVMNQKQASNIAEATPSGAGLASATTQYAEESIMKALPKSIQDKLEKGLPLTNQDVKKIEAVRERLNRAKGVSVEQQELGLGVSIPMLPFKAFRGLATKTTPAGNTVDIAKGALGLSTNGGKIIADKADELPSLISRTINQFPSLSAKSLRGLVANTNSLYRKSPAFGKVVDDMVFNPIKEFQAHASRVNASAMGRLLESKRTAGLNKNDQKVLADFLDGDTNALINAKAPDDIKFMADEMRQIYDEMLTELNRQELIAGVKLTPRREDYFPHIRELLGEEKFLQPAKPSDPDFVRRVGSAFRFGKQRTGDIKNRKTDPFEVMDIYLKATEGRIASLVPSRNINLIMDSLDQVKLLDGRGRSELKGWFRGINDDLTGAKAGSNPIERVQGRIAAGTILANPSSIIMNAIQPTVIMPARHPIASVRGLYGSFMSAVKYMQDGNIDDYLKVGGIESSYLRNVYNGLDLRRLQDKSILRKMGDTAARSFYVTDIASKKQVMETLYQAELTRGLKPKDALRVAEFKAEGVLPSRTPGTLATAFRNSTPGRMANLFQTEVFAQAETIGEMLRPRGVYAAGPQGNRAKGSVQAAASLMGLAIAGHVFNEGFSQAFPGRRPAPDPIDWLQKAIENDKIVEGEQQDDTLLEDTLQFVTAGIGQLPVVGGMVSKFDARTPFPALEIASGMADTVKDAVNENFSGESLTRAGRNLSALAGRGVKPVYRGIEGAISFAKGGDDKGFEVNQTPANAIRAVLGGAYNSPEASEMFKNSDNKKKVIGSFDEQTQNKYKSIISKITKKDGELTKHKSIVDQANQFGELQGDPELTKLSNAMAQFDKAQGKPIDPVFDPEFYEKNDLDLQKDQMKVFNYLVEGSRNNDVIAGAMKKLHPWLKKLDDERSKFFDSLPEPNSDIPETVYGPAIPKPEIDNVTRERVNQFFSIEDFTVKNKYLVNNPDVAEYLSKTAEYDRAKRIYLGQPIPDEYPEMNPKIKALNDKFHSLPKGDGPKGGSPTRSAFLKAHPGLIAQWTAQNIWQLQQEGAESLYEGIDFSQKALEKVNKLASNLVQLPDGTWVFDPNSFGGAGRSGDGFGSGGGGGQSAGRPSPNITNFASKGGDVDLDVPQIKLKRPQIRKLPAAGRSSKRIDISSLILPNKLPTFSSSNKRK